MKKFILSLLAVLFLSTYALAQTPPCPCDNETLENGLTGNDIVEIVCPSGNLGEDSESFMGDGGTVISLIDFPHSDYVVRINNTGTPQCTINSDGVEPILLSITQQEYNNCQKRLIQGLRSTDKYKCPYPFRMGAHSDSRSIGNIWPLRNPKKKSYSTIIRFRT